MTFENEIKKITESLPYYEKNEFDNKKTQKLIIYGAGFMGNKYASLLTEAGFDVVGFFESGCKEDGAVSHDGISISLPKLTEHHVVISSVKYFKPMKDTLISLGYDEKSIISPFGIADKFYFPEFRKAFDMFSDDLSKKLVISKIRYLFSSMVMKPVSEYFDFLMFNDNWENEIFVDGGSFDGETSIEFAAVSDNRYKKIYCFEPTKSSYDVLTENIKCLERTEAVPKGIYSSDTVLKFKDFGTDQWNAVNDFFMGHEWNGPKIEHKIIEVPVVSLDSFFSDKNPDDYPTIIKLDIEGSEKEALYGMRNILNTSHPKLIICAYHKIEDYYELPMVINEICPGYKMHLRHYTDNVFESILFAEWKES